MIQSMKLLTGQQIRVGRFISDMTKKDLSECADVGTTTITRIESSRDKIHANWNLLDRIERCLSAKLVDSGWRFTDSGGVEPLVNPSIPDKQ